ncbi:hypothetical protein [Phytomonospora endophytica]|uniref:Uncharacterized protein n=1 Tax=Phytomonospora endophytica TaxID=714109 RepID=A0A841FE78_9ACTN|nr:hypothetical protein [Phytomonospora endophytica]MBB6034134.1 hypothetical protein [Phytomonospora endophytica]GIG66526.1 hypothetical protein Pen01_28210 [Phytomonospora endophytica]
MSENLFLLIPVAVLAIIVLGAVAVLKAQKAAWHRLGTMAHAAPPGGFQQSPHETREEFVRRNWQRSGVVANGPTLIDLYDRVRALEQRLAEAERRLGPPA